MGGSGSLLNVLRVEGSCPVGLVSLAGVLEFGLLGGLPEVSCRLWFLGQTYNSVPTLLHSLLKLLSQWPASQSLA